MKTSHTGMTLFELLIVMIIIGVVYSIGIFTVKKEKVPTEFLTLSSLKTTLLSLSSSGATELVCDDTRQECDLYTSDKKIVTTLRLHTSGPIMRCGFSPAGELRILGNTIISNNSKSVSKTFSIKLNSDGIFTPLILKNNNTFYAYTPLGGDQPFITMNEDRLKKYLFNDSFYPLKRDAAYGSF